MLLKFMTLIKTNTLVLFLCTHLFILKARYLNKILYQDANEIKLVLNGMLNMLSLNDVFDSDSLADNIRKNLDLSHDQKISKG